MTTQTSRLDRTQQELARNILAASSTTAFCVAVMNPIDVLRIQWQTKPNTTTASSSSSSVTQFISSQIRLHRQNGDFVRRVYLPGVGVNAMSVATSSGLRLGLYPVTKEALFMITARDGESAGGAVMFAAGFLSGALGFLVATPFFAAKIKAQSYTATAGDKSGWQCLRETCRPPNNPFRGASILVSRGALFSAGFSLGYDGTKTRLRQGQWGGGGGGEGPLVHAFASVVAATVSTALAAPFDAMLTRFQVTPNATIVGCARSILAESGPQGFFRGWSLFFARVAPLFVIQLPLYEQTRRLLGMGFM